MHKIGIQDLHLRIFRCSHNSSSSHSSNVSRAAGAAGAAGASARPSGRSRRNLCRAHSRICQHRRGPLSHSRCLHIFRFSRERCTDRSMNTAGNTAGMCSRTRTILLQETAAGVAKEETEAVDAVETVEAAKCTVDHSRCNRCQEDIGSSRWSETRSLALRLHRRQHRMTGRRYKKSMN